MPNIPMRIRKSQVRFYQNQEVDPVGQPGVFKDILQFGVECTLPTHKELPTYSIRIRVDPGTAITCAMINIAIQQKVAELLAQKQLDDAARQQMGNCPGVTEDNDWFYVTIST